MKMNNEINLMNIFELYNTSKDKFETLYSFKDLSLVYAEYINDAGIVGKFAGFTADTKFLRFKTNSEYFENLVDAKNYEYNFGYLFGGDNVDSEELKSIDSNDKQAFYTILFTKHTALDSIDNINIIKPLPIQKVKEILTAFMSNSKANYDAIGDYSYIYLNNEPTSITQDECFLFEHAEKFIRDLAINHMLEVRGNTLYDYIMESNNKDLIKEIFSKLLDRIDISHNNDLLDIIGKLYKGSVIP